MEDSEHLSDRTLLQEIDEDWPNARVTMLSHEPVTAVQRPPIGVPVDGNDALVADKEDGEQRPPVSVPVDDSDALVADKEDGEQESDNLIGSNPEGITGATAKAILSFSLISMSCVSSLPAAAYMAGVGHWTNLYGVETWVVLNLLISLPWLLVLPQYYFDRKYNVRTYACHCLQMHDSFACRFDADAGLYVAAPSARCKLWFAATIRSAKLDAM